MFSPSLWGTNVIQLTLDSTIFGFLNLHLWKLKKVPCRIQTILGKLYSKNIFIKKIIPKQGQ